jgi:hypothetical protein
MAAIEVTAAMEIGSTDSHNALCTVFNRCEISSQRLSQPFRDCRRSAEIAWWDYAVSFNIGCTLSSCRQANIDICCCL